MNLENIVNLYNIKWISLAFSYIYVVCITYLLLLQHEKDFTLALQCQPIWSVIMILKNSINLYNFQSIYFAFSTIYLICSSCSSYYILRLLWNVKPSILKFGRDSWKPYHPVQCQINIFGFLYYFLCSLI